MAIGRPPASHQPGTGNANPAVHLPTVLERLIYELLDAHYDTARLAEDVAEDEHWQAHLAYLRDLQRVAREALAATAAEQEACTSGAPTRRD